MSKQQVSLWLLGFMVILFVMSSGAQAKPLQQGSADAAQGDTGALQLFLPLIVSDVSRADAEIAAASLEQQSNQLYTKYLYSRWSNPANHYSVRFSNCGLLLICSVQSAQNVATMNLNDYANATITGLNLFSSIGKIAWADLEQTAAVGDYAGWQIANASLGNLSLFRNSYLRTYLNGQLQEQYSISSLTDWGLIANLDGGQSVAFRAKKAFNRVEIYLDSGTLGLSLFNSIQFYYAFAAKMQDLDHDNVPDVFDSDIDGDGLPNTIESCTAAGSLNYEFYNSSPSGLTVKNISTAGADQSGIVSHFDANSLQSQITPFDAFTYSIRYSGILNVPYEDNFTFTLESEGGSALWLDDSLIVDNDGWHSNQARTGTIHLLPGYHTVRLLYFKYLSGSGFTLSVSSSSLPKQPIPFNVFISCNSQIDSDGDGLPNQADMDSDNDTIPDLIEVFGQ
ncbi:MAG: PA14 domain-containing protein [Caldilineaceae bacterium]